jgi:hypothetical protein
MDPNHLEPVRHFLSLFDLDERKEYEEWLDNQPKDEPEEPEDFD